MNSGFASTLGKLVLFQIFSVLMKICLCKTVVQTGNPPKSNVIRFHSFPFYGHIWWQYSACFTGKCSMERIWVLIKRVKETLVARFPES